MKKSEIKKVFLDIGGVILTNGWDRHCRERAAEHFKLDIKEMNERHQVTFDMFEMGHITLDAYLDYIVFYQPRSFTHEQFKKFMFEQSQPLQEMIDLVRGIKFFSQCKIVATSNEGKELMDYRIKKYDLAQFIDIFICSGYIRVRKPSNVFYQTALDVANAKPHEVLYIDDRPFLAEIGQRLGFHVIHHVNVETTRASLKSLLGLEKL